MNDSEGNTPIIEVKGLEARFGDKVVLEDVDFVALPSYVTAVLGGSGSGKSTLIRHILGLLRPVKGTIRLLGQDITNASPQQMRQIRSKIGVLFQSHALLTSKTVGENLALVLRENTGLPESLIWQIVRMKLAQVGLEGAVELYPAELSGGMAKRAALARSIAFDPEVLFCDEPTSGLDPVTAEGLDDLLLTLKKRYDMTIIVVTHELASIKKIADKVVMLDRGKMIASGDLDDIMHSENEIVSDFFNRRTRSKEKQNPTLYSLMRGQT